MLKTLQKAQKGFTIIELLIVIAIIAILAGLVLNNFQGAQAKARDTQRVTRTNALHSKLEEFYNEASAYPNSVSDASWFPGIDAKSLEDARGGAISSVIVADAAALDAVGVSTNVPVTGSGNEYIYATYPTGCTTTASTSGGSTTYTVGATPCVGYKLLTFVERPTTTTPNPYVKTGLQNP